MTIYRAGKIKTPPGFFTAKVGKRMNKMARAKTLLAVVAIFVFATSAARASTITPVSPPDSGFDLTSSTDLTQTSGDLFTTTNLSPSTVAGTGSSFGPVSGGPGPVTIQPVPNPGPVVDRVPDTGSTVFLMALALGGLAAIQRRLTRA